MLASSRNDFPVQGGVWGAHITMCSGPGGQRVHNNGKLPLRTGYEVRYTVTCTASASRPVAAAASSGSSPAGGAMCQVPQDWWPAGRAALLCSAV